MGVYVAEGVNAQAVEKYVRDSVANGINPRAFQVLKNNKPLIRMAFEPYRFDEPMHLYSLSKSFTSVACGICVDEGLLSPETKMCELFADKMPAEMTDALREMKLGDLLSMQSGHSACVLHHMRWADDSIKAFFEQPTTYKPGTTFAYSTAATCVCAAAVERVTGKKLVDFLDERLFSKLDIKKPKWLECRDGQTLGGTGLFLSSDDITKFGVMLYNKGVYNGTRIVSEEYLADATKSHSVDINNGSIDWISGYGYQFWLNARGGFRGDGAFGQLCLVFPEEDIVITMQAEAGNMAKEVELIYELMDNMLGEGGSVEALEQLANTLYAPEKSAPFNSELEFGVEDNYAEVRKLRLFGESLLHIELETDYGKKELVCGNGEFLLNHIMLKNMTPSITILDPAVNTVERLSVFAAYKINENGSVSVTLRHKNTCHVQHWTIDPAEKKLSISLLAGDMVCPEFKLI
ncbi:MAG: beta-lactamase family protein [Clostridia bacterium]|nr:beta-lactamase family protein [Clostridia bacterium]